MHHADQLTRGMYITSTTHFVPITL